MRTIQFQEDLTALALFWKEKGFENSTILITGATGYIGSIILKSIIEFNRIFPTKIKCVALARSLDKIRMVFSDEFNYSDKIPYVTFVIQDITTPISDEIKCDYIVHTANSTISKYFISNPIEVIDSIYNGSKQVFEYAGRAQVKGLVYLSSMEVFGQVYGEKRVEEAELGYIDIQNIRSCYSEGKRLVECLAASYAHEKHTPVRVARLAQTFGAGILPTENRVFAQFARSAIKGEDIILHTKGESYGNYCYTTDVIKAIIILLKEGQSGEAYTVVNEETTRSIYDMANFVAKNFSKGRSKVVIDIPKGQEFGYAPDTKLKLSSRKMNSLGWKPEYGLREMYERMIPDMQE